MGKSMIAVRDVDEEVFRRFRAKVIEERMKLGRALTLAMGEWLKEKKEKADPKNLLKIKPVKVGKKKVRWSEEIDEILYGLKK